MSHANAPLTPEGRRRLGKLIVDDGWAIRRAAERYQVSPATASKWAKRYRADESLTDRSSRPHVSPNQLSRKRERRIIALRFNRRWGPHRISYHLGIPRSTVGRVLTRYQMPLLAHVDQATGLPVRTARPVRYERSRPGELIHVDIKKLGRIPDGVAGARKAALLGTETTARVASGMRSFTTPLMTIPGWCIPRSWVMNAKKPRQHSGGGRVCSSPRRA